jgi:short-subunit dehydrogenase
MARSRRVAVITGASAGVGRATAWAFAKDGAWIGLLARGRDGLEEARREIEDVGSRALVLPADVSSAEEVEAAAVRVEQELGPIDVWVNCAMVSVFSPVREMKADEFRRVMEVNYLGYVHGTLAALRFMVPRNRGVIVQVSSALAFRSIPLQSAYCASKRAIVGFTESLRSELIHDGSKVEVTMVHLPAVNTPHFEWVRTRLPNEPQPLPPVYQPEVAAKAILWAAGHRRRDVTVGFSTAKAINANKLFPGLLDRLLARKAYREQQADAPVDPNRPDNLYAPVPEDRGAHGRFDQQARRRSVQLWVTTHRRWLAAGLLVAGVLGLRRRPA